MRATELVAALNKRIESVGDCEMHLVTGGRIWFVESVTTDVYEVGGPMFIEIESNREDDT